MTDETPTPRTATALFGHQAAVAEFRAALDGGRVHHAWLISGVKGIGKATLAYHFARAVLSGGEWGLSPESPLFRRIVAGSHTDLLVLEAPYDADKDETKREIPIELARQVGEFLALTPAEGNWRVVIIDSIDEMNPNAANAILKVLEEPPPRSLLLLVSHNPGRLLPTIRSRCRHLKLPPLTREAFSRIVQAHAPELSEYDAHALGVLTDFSPGAALALREHEALASYGEWVGMMQKLGQGAAPPLGAFAERMAGGTGIHARWQVLGQLAARFFSRALEMQANEDFEEIVSGEGAALKTLLAHYSLPAIAGLHASAVQQFSVAARSHLDYKTVLITYLYSFTRSSHAA